MRIQFYNQKYTNDILGKAKTTNIPGLEWQDIAQELDIALWKNLDKFKGINNAKERTFVITLLRNKIFDLAKGSNRLKRRIDSHHLVFSQLEATEEGSMLLDLARPIL